MKRFVFSNCTMAHNDLFLIGMMGGLLAQMSPDSGEIRYYDIMKEFAMKEKTVIVDFLDFYQNKIYALDSKEDNLVIFDMENSQCQYISLECSHQPWLNFVAFERYGSNYYIFPKYENIILVFDIEKSSIRRETDYLNNIDEVQCACRVGNSVWLLPKGANVIYCYHLDNKSTEVYELNNRIEDCVHAIFDGEYIHILNKYGIIYRWDIKQKELQENVVLETKHCKEESMSRIIHAGNQLILLPAWGNDIKILDIETKKVEVYHDYPNDFLFQRETFKFYGYCENEKYYFFAQCFGNYFLKIEKQSGEFVWVKPVIDSLGGRAIELLRNRIFYESDLELTDLFKINITDKCGTDRTYIGEKIYTIC